MPFESRNKTFCFLILLIFLFGGLQSSAEDNQASLENNDKEYLDAILVLDASGSMLVTDPNRLRDEGARLLTQFLTKNDRLAIVEFSDKATLLRPLSPYDPSQLSQVTRTIQGIKTLGGYTDLLAPIKLAENIFKRSPRENAEQVIILLSDGKMDPVPSRGSSTLLTDELFQQYLPELAGAGVKVHTLSLSEQADKELLLKMSERTGGVNWYTPTADEIHQKFAELFLVVKKPQIVPLTAKGFKIDGEVQEATFYINRDEDRQVGLVSPDGTEITRDTVNPQVKWFQGTKYEVITIITPAPGQWQVLGLAKNEGFATLLTDLKLLTSWPTSIQAGIPYILEAQLFESKKPVILPRLSGVVKFAFQITPVDRVSEPVVREFLSDDGSEGDKAANDGIFSRRVVVEEPGEYKLQLLATTPTFERHQQLIFRVKPRLLELEVIPVEESVLGTRLTPDELEQAVGAEYFRIKLSEKLAKSRKIDVELIAIDSEDNRYKLPLSKIDRTYETPVTNLPADGTWIVRAQYKAEDKKRHRSRGESQEIEYLKVSKNGDEEPVVKLIVEDKPDAPPAPPKKPMSAGLVVLIVSLVNILSGGAGYFLLAKEQNKLGGDEEADQFAPSEPIEELITRLTERAEASEVDLEAPIFTDDSIDVQILDPALLSAASAKNDPTPTIEGGAESSEGGASEEEDAEEPTNDEPSEEEDDA